MTYAGARRILDADSHIMELPDFLDEYVTEEQRGELNRVVFEARREVLDAAVASLQQRRSDADAQAAADERLMRDKGWSAMGGWDKAERSRTLDLLGFDAQLVFGTFGTMLYKLSKTMDVYEGTRAYNRALADFCSDDPRLLAVANIQLDDPQKAAACATEAIELGCKAVMIPSQPAGKLAPTHPDVDPFWDVLEKSGTPFVLHIGGGKSTVDRAYHNNGMPVLDHLGGGENIRSKDYIAIHHSPGMFLGALVLDGLFDRFPGLRGGSIEQGAVWVPSWMRQLDEAARTFKREAPLQKLSKKPSEFVSEHLTFTPFPGEPVAWMVEQAGAELFMFSSDYPHPEGTTDPLGKFEATMDGLSEEARDAFYSGNMARLMGRQLALTSA